VFEEEEEEIGIASDLVEAMGEGYRDTALSCICTRNIKSCPTS